LSEDTLVFPPKEDSATKSPDLVELEKEVFGLRLKAMELDACQHKILNLQVIIFEKDAYINTLKKDLLEANAERIRLSSECETATSSITSFKIKVASLQERFIVLKFQYEIEREIFFEDQTLYRQSLGYKDIKMGFLRKKVHDLENPDSVKPQETKESPTPPNRTRDSKPAIKPNVKPNLEANSPNKDDPSISIGKKKKFRKTKPNNSTEPRAPCPEENKPAGAKRVGTDRGKSVKPHTPNGLRDKNSKSKGARTSVKPIENLDF